MDKKKAGDDYNINILDLYPNCKEEIAHRVIEGEAVIVTVDNRTLHSLNEVGTRIWELITQKIPVKEIIKHIYEEFDAPKKEIEQDVFDFINKLKEKEIITLDNKPAE